MGNDYLVFLRQMQKISINANRPRPGDYEENGILHCGKCHKPRRAFKSFDYTDADGQPRTEILKVGITCDCDKAEEERRKAEEQRRRDLERIEKLRSISLMDDRMKESKFGCFEETKFNSKNLKLCKRYVDKFDQMMANNQGLMFWGDVGTGKSYAAACIANALLDRMHPVVMTSFVKLIAAMDADRTISEHLINQLNAADLVIFDDLGTERSTDTALEKVYNIIDSRYRRKRPMIVTTNVTMEQMKDEPDLRYRRIYDRLFEGCYPMQFVGPSWRKKAAAKSWDEMARLLEGD